MRFFCLRQADAQSARDKLESAIAAKEHSSAPNGDSSGGSALKAESSTTGDSSESEALKEELQRALEALTASESSKLEADDLLAEAKEVIKLVGTNSSGRRHIASRERERVTVGRSAQNSCAGVLWSGGARTPERFDMNLL